LTLLIRGREGHLARPGFTTARGRGGCGSLIGVVANLQGFRLPSATSQHQHNERDDRCLRGPHRPPAFRPPRSTVSGRQVYGGEYSSPFSINGTTPGGIFSIVSTNCWHSVRLVNPRTALHRFSRVWNQEGESFHITHAQSANAVAADRSKHSTIKIARIICCPPASSAPP